MYVGNSPVSGPARPLHGTGTGDGTTTVFAMGFSPQTVNHVQVLIDGHEQEPTTAYTISGSNCTFTSAPMNGEHIDFKGHEVGKDTVPQDNSIDASKMATGELPFSKSFTSSEQTITSAGSLTLPHSLGSSPSLVQARLICKTAELGYSIGDEVIINPDTNSVGTFAGGTSIVVDATNLNIRYGATAGAYHIIRKDTGVTTVITPANWKLIVRAWA